MSNMYPLLIWFSVSSNLDINGVTYKLAHISFKNKIVNKDYFKI